jgi:hypothetical protein
MKPCNYKQKDRNKCGGFLQTAANAMSNLHGMFSDFDPMSTTGRGRKSDRLLGEPALLLTWLGSI